MDDGDEMKKSTTGTGKAEHTPNKPSHLEITDLVRHHASEGRSYDGDGRGEGVHYPQFPLRDAQ